MYLRVDGSEHFMPNHIQSRCFNDSKRKTFSSTTENTHMLRCERERERERDVKQMRGKVRSSKRERRQQEEIDGVKLLHTLSKFVLLILITDNVISSVLMILLLLNTQS